MASSILVDITFKNPRTYPISAAILSEFLLFLDTEGDRIKLLDKIIKKFQLIPNTGHLQIWLQRISIKYEREKEYSERLCKKVNDPMIEIWNSDWLNDELKNMIKNEAIVDENTIEEMSNSIVPNEVQLFESKSGYSYDTNEE